MDPGFSRGGGDLLFDQFFSENCRKVEKFWPRGRCASFAPPFSRFATGCECMQNTLARFIQLQAVCWNLPPVEFFHGVFRKILNPPLIFTWWMSQKKSKYSIIVYNNNNSTQGHASQIRYTLYLFLMNDIPDYCISWCSVQGPASEMNLTQFYWAETSSITSCSVSPPPHGQFSNSRTQ